jgi:hypothetical protein
MKLQTINALNNSMGATPFAFISIVDYETLSKKKFDENDFINLTDNTRVINVKGSNKIESGKIALNMLLRQSLRLSLDEIRDYENYDGEKDLITSLSISVTPLGDSKLTSIDCNELRNFLINNYNQVLFYHGESIGIKFNNYFLKLSFSNLEFMSGRKLSCGMLTNVTEINFIKNGLIRLENDGRQNEIFSKSFDFKELDIGGLNDELTTILRKVFVSRLLPNNVIEKLKLTQVKH